MDKKVAIIIAGLAVLIVAAGVVFFVTKDKGNPEASSGSQSAATTDATPQSAREDLGLCDIVDKAAVKSALGAAAENLAGPNNTGVTGLGDGDKGQTCVYPFVKDGNTNNSFYTDLAQYSQKSYEAVADFTATSGTQVSGVGDRATFQSGDTVLGAKEFTITAVKGTNVYKFVISQPKNAVTFDDASAQTALTTIAQAAKLK